jgi:hypothetical protein
MSGVNFFNILGAAAFLHGTGWILESAAGPAGARGPEHFRVAFLAVAAAVTVALALYAFTSDTRGARDTRSASFVPGRNK